MVHWEKQNIILYLLNFKKWEPLMSIYLYDFSMDQILEKSSYIEFIGKTINVQLPNHLNDP